MQEKRWCDVMQLDTTEVIFLLSSAWRKTACLRRDM